MKIKHSIYNVKDTYNSVFYNSTVRPVKCDGCHFIIALFALLSAMVDTL